MPNRGDKPYAATLGAVGAAAMVAVAGLTLALAQRRRRYVWQHTLVKPTDRCTLLNARPSSASHAASAPSGLYTAVRSGMRLYRKMVLSVASKTLWSRLSSG
jgi:hypothetical protein